jgi:Cu2+-exporting ATPase
MPFPLIAFAGGVAIGGLIVVRPRHHSQLMAALEPLQPPLRPSRYQRLRDKLRHPFANTVRQQQLQAMASVSDKAEQTIFNPVEQRLYQDLKLSLLATGMATLGLFTFPILLPLTAPIVVYIWREVYVGAYRALVKERRITADIVHALTQGMALAVGFFFAASLISAIFGMSRLLLLRTRDQSRSALLDIFTLQNPKVWLNRNGVEVEVLIDDLARDDIVVVHAGEVIPVDGVVVAGIASVDQRILTGEAQPAEKEVGDEVFASTTLLTGKVQIRVIKTGAETTSAQIVAILNRTVDYRTAVMTRSEQLQDRIALPVLALSGLALATVGFPGALAVLNSNMLLSFMIVSPLSTLSFLNMASRHGVLVKDGRALELLADVDTVVFDKTGTLTQEIPHVAQIYVCGEYGENTVLTYAAAAEHRQRHPVAKAILQAAAERDLALPAIDAADYKVGYGIKVNLNGNVVRVGSTRFMDLEAITMPPAIQTAMATGHDYGASFVMVAVDDKLVGALELHPTIRPETQTVIQQLRQLGVQSMHIISGDHEAPTRAMAEGLGLYSYSAEVLPSQKAAIIAQMQEEGRRICYVGDGINDSIALKQANVSVSLRGASTVATDTAQVILMDEDLEQLVHLFTVAKGFNRNLTQCLTIAAIPGLLNIYGAFFLHFGLISSVICNQIGMWSGIENATRPLLAQRRADRRAALQLETDSPTV